MTSYSNLRSSGASIDGMEAVELKDRRASTSGRKSGDLEAGEEDIGVPSSSWNGAPGPSQGGHRRQESHGAEDEDGSELELLLDPNLPAEYSHKLGDLTRKSLSFDDNQVGVKFGESEDEEEEVENSPYPEVRAAVLNFDQDLPCNTIRAWTIGLGLIFLGASMNTIFSLRAPSISLGSLIAQIIAWPLGHGWARFMPEREFNTFGKRWTLNPGPFNIKEHSVIVVMASVSFSVAYATDIILAQKVFYKQDFGLLWGGLLTISTQSLGYGIAGMLRRFLVYPASMIWPGNLVGVTLMHAMYGQNEKKNPTIMGGSIARYRWFAYITLGSFLYYFIPGFFAQFLSSFAVVTWMAPNNPVVNQLFGYSTGLSLLPITFDWAQITGYVGSPMVPPWHAIANTLAGVVIFFIIAASFLQYTGAWYGKYLPMSDSNVYDNTGKTYDVSRVLGKEFTLDEAAYNTYSPLFLSTSERPDVHMKMMRKYKEAPTWWYMSLFAVMLALGFFTVLGWQTNLTWWAFLLAVFISFAFSLPIGIIQAVTNNQIGLNVLTEFVFGYIQPGRPLALMIFKTFGYITMSQALTFVGDLKFGHYMKLPPRVLFSAQVVATTFSCIIQILVLNYALRTIPEVCTPSQPQHFTCPGGRVFFSASVIWGLIGPARMFSPGQIYSSLFLFFILGAVVPLVIWLLLRRAQKRNPHTKTWLRYVIAPVIFGGAGSIPPASPLNYLSWGIVGYGFQYVVRKRHFGWWSRLNFLTSCGLDLGLALATLVVFFAFTINEISPPSWWGNEVVKGTLDFKGMAVRERVREGEIFGPRVWALGGGGGGGGVRIWGKQGKTDKKEVPANR
ncbi:small oligopeptide transporter [Neurospora hispaniola]|uniref:Small oligopeptide transporter n=1 Tax=Neurospora hispaniola TaxID=588809 RepID=A0AAJ0MSF0_9PEZI|nr:small oligopeptide transporter [Neurospora hispaniola]